jgi:hypothetical protein
VLALGAYAVVLSRHVGAVAAGSDSSGYMNSARLIASGHVHVHPRTIEGLPPSGMDAFLYTPLGFKPAPDGDGIVPTYPAGLSLLVLAMRPFAGWEHAGDAALVLHALAGVAATFLLARLLGLGRLWSLYAAAAVGLSPLYLYMSVQAMSDIPSLAWTTLAVAAALQGRKSARWALAAGFALAIDVLLRPSNVLAFLPVGVALGLSPRRWLLLALGGFPGAVFFMAHNERAYGSLLTTGYGDFSFAFGASYIHETLLHYVNWMPRLFTPAVIAAAALPFQSSVAPRTRWILCLWILAYGAFYATYSCTHETWWYLRFLLPAAPALVIGGLLAIRSLLGLAFGSPESGWCLLGLAAVAAFSARGLYEQNLRLNPLDVGPTERRYVTAASWMREHVPAQAICLTMQESGALTFYTDFTVLRWDWIVPDAAARVEAALERSGRPVYAVLFPFEIEESKMLSLRIPGTWTAVHRIEDITIFRRDPIAPKP